MSISDTLRPLIVKFLQQTRLNRIAHRLYYRYFHGFDTANKPTLPALAKALAKAADYGMSGRGDYMEFGLFKGYAFWHAQVTAKRLGLADMRFFGFDSFAGMPDIAPEDETTHGEFYKGQFCCTKESVSRNLEAKGVDWNRTVLTEGYFDQSLTPELKQRHGMKKIAVALIDCDLYTSTRDVLNFIADLLQEGTVLMFDDWNCFDRDDDRGQRRAVREFLAQRPGVTLEHFFDYGAYGKVFIAHVQPQP